MSGHPQGPQVSEEIVGHAAIVLRKHFYVWAKPGKESECGGCDWEGSDTGPHHAEHVAGLMVEAVAPALMAEKDAEIEQLRTVADSMQHFADVAVRVERRNNELHAELAAARAEGAAEVSAAVEAVFATCSQCGLTKQAAIQGVLCDPPYAGNHIFPGASLIRDRVRAAITPEGIAAYRARIAAEALDAIADAIHSARHDGGSSRKPDSFFWGIARAESIVRGDA